MFMLGRYFWDRNRGDVESRQACWAGSVQAGGDGVRTDGIGGYDLFLQLEFSHFVFL